MQDVSQAAQTIGKFLQTFTLKGRLRLRFSVKLRGPKRGAAASGSGGESLDASSSGLAAPTDAAAGGHSRSLDPRSLYVEFTGPDTNVLTARNGEVLNALEHIAAKILRLEPDQHDQVSFDADHFKENRDRELRELASAAIERVLAMGQPHSFPPMTSRERRMLHMVLGESGLPTASSGEGPGRFVVLYPKGADTSAPFDSEQTPRRHDASRLRDTFRHR